MLTVSRNSNVQPSMKYSAFNEINKVEELNLLVLVLYYE
jgi:hypothetical protein